jgi:hypothetical protein
MANKNQNQPGNKKPPTPKETVSLFVSDVRPGDREITLQAIVMDTQHNLLSGIPVDFKVNDRSQVGTFLTVNGWAKCIIPMPPSSDALENLTFRAVTAQASSEEKRPDLSKYSTPFMAGEVVIFREEIKHGPGHHTFYLAALDARTRMPVDREVVLRLPLKNGEIEIDGQCRYSDLPLMLHANGEIIEIKTQAPGRNEIDLIPRTWPEGKAQLEIYGPAYVRLKVNRDNPSGLAQFCDGFI